MARLVLAGLALAAPGLGRAAPGAPEACSGPVSSRLPCLTEALGTAERDLASVRADLPGRIDARTEVPAADRESWKSALARATDLWLAFRDAECDPDLVALFSGRRGPEAQAASLVCRAGITRVVASDLKARFGLDPAAPARAAVDRSGGRRGEASADPAADPCAEAPPGDCEGCGRKSCWERIARRADVFLSGAWTAAQAALGRRPGLSAAQRNGVLAKLGRAQRQWTEWRNEACSAEAYEAPDRRPAPAYGSRTGPCLSGETFERTKTLRLVAAR